MTAYEDLLAHARETMALSQIAGRLGWDQETMMPRGAAPQRGEEMAAIDQAIDAGETAAIADRLSDKWLDDVTLFGSASRVRERVEAWRETGVKTPILVPSSAAGNQLKAVQEIFAAFD